MFIIVTNYHIWGRVLLAALCLLCAEPEYLSAETPVKNRQYYESTGEVVWNVPTAEKVISLTFDDGPHPEDTAQILDLLKMYHAHATFFIVGNKAERNPELLKRELAEGHELANHTYSHPYFRRSTPKETILRELEQTQETINRIAGVKTNLFRPPGGFYSDKLVQTVRQSGYTVVLWSWHLDTEDWKSPGVQRIASNVLNHVRNGDIVLFHDWVEGKSDTIDALKLILPELEKRGYRFVTVSELLKYKKNTPVQLQKSYNPE
ncbi:polysaccharide deacetylase family protein [Paenibacillus hamazuiensis]|uniref:polysaccharide deacetylase family protein n=1 Tax=Paenibacillus hamazuiensis TaxID=2936508 RepID=UPI00200F930C|nr:polysaccharide deacetylase family protein [Paenibacillus hamazuiensis]